MVTKTALDDVMICENELERMWKKAVVAKFMTLVSTDYG